ncbi:MAG: hypothetical protein RI907_1419, partial [Pseudomonadota bacterium]
MVLLVGVLMFVGRTVVISTLIACSLTACGGGGSSTESAGPTVTKAAEPVASEPAPATSTPEVPSTPVSTLAIKAQPQAVSVTAGGDAMFTVEANQTTGVTYQWSRNGKELAGETGVRLLLKGVTLDDSGAKFTVSVKATDATVKSAEAVLTVTAAAATAYPIMFATSVPGTGFGHQLNTFSNHSPLPGDAVAGGDLFIRYPDGTLRNLTKEAGWGVASGSIQGGAKAISVRQPSMHWDGKKALFSMMVGGATVRYANPARYWQIYEVSGLAKGEKVVITKVANQPEGYHNISPIYGTDDNILFISDAPLYGMKVTYPQLDEYEASATNTGVWKLNVSTGAVTQLQHAPSGVFDLFLDSFGRVLFTKWDHLQRDQEADLDRYSGANYGTIDFASETSTVTKAYPQRDSNGKLIADAKGVLYDQFPQPRIPEDPVRFENEMHSQFNQFTVWQVNEDGSNEETINHAGRHEFGGAFQPVMYTDDPNLSDQFVVNVANSLMRKTFRSDAGIFQVKEDVNRPGVYLGTYANEFHRQAAGRVVEFKLPPGMNPEDVVITDYTNATLDDDPEGNAAALP